MQLADFLQQQGIEPSRICAQHLSGNSERLPWQRVVDLRQHRAAALSVTGGQKVGPGVAEACTALPAEKMACHRTPRSLEREIRAITGDTWTCRDDNTKIIRPSIAMSIRCAPFLGGTTVLRLKRLLSPASYKGLI
ncbi:hypothetical protein [Deinococcus peraridilitoris]|uniref:hypothetical protein n=1 Tax=Deinococcus peraridilitoris TaxID=432329 RepID=UPI00059E2934|nr:hypothetical protein [Deinococcus peraridilitoris]